MKRFEYRIKEVFFQRDEVKEQQLLEALNALGHEGWHVTLIEGDPQKMMNGNSIRIWLEREVNSQAA